MKKRYSEEQIIGFRKEAESGVPTKELCHAMQGFALMRTKVFHGEQRSADVEHGDAPPTDADFSTLILGEFANVSNSHFIISFAQRMSL